MDAICKHPFTGQITTVPVEMIGAFVPYTPGLLLEEAAKVALARDYQEAENLLHMVTDRPEPIPEGTYFDELSVEPATLR